MTRTEIQKMDRPLSPATADALVRIIRERGASIDGRQAHSLVLRGLAERTSWSNPNYVRATSKGYRYYLNNR